MWFSRNGHRLIAKTYDALIQHVYDGRRHRDRLEVEFLIQRRGKPFHVDGYLWVKDTRTELAGSLLKAAQFNADMPLRLTLVETTWGNKILWAEMIESNVTTWHKPGN
jgi:hypothetical protein